MKNAYVFLLAVLAFVVGLFVANWYITSKKVCYKLPTEGGPEAWGKYYWGAIHDVLSRVPCSLCRNEGEEMGRFIHDAVNFKLDRDLHDRENFLKYLQKFSDIKDKITNGARY